MKVTVEMEENCDFLLTHDTASQMHKFELTFRVKHSGHCLVSTLHD